MAKLFENSEDPDSAASVCQLPFFGLQTKMD